MTYIPDLSEYTYARSTYYRPITKAVGWLDRGHWFDVTQPTEELLDLVWRYCAVSVAQTRGYHACELCPSTFSPQAERNGDKLLLGTSEIRVFGSANVIYAAPTMIYHYMSIHHYKPPDEFLQAMRENPAPPDPRYFALLKKVDLAWATTSRPSDPAREAIIATPVARHSRLRQSLRRARRFAKSWFG